MAEAKKTTPKIVKPNHDAEILEACVSPVLNMIGAVADLKKLWGDQAVEDAIKMIPQPGLFIEFQKSSAVPCESWDCAAFLKFYE